tara:strand:- start:58 stop:201 length:144 start_codon:yes stop_codon:yes gene_type:complete
MKKALFFSVFALIFFSCEKDSENLPAPYYSIEGKWTFGDNSLNTMYP